jgi:hypothetical protein
MPPTAYPHQANRPQEESAVELEREGSIDRIAIPDLTGVIGFSYDDVNYNQAGQLSPAQRHQLRKVSLNDLFGLAVALGFVAIAFALGARVIPAIAAIFFIYKAVVAVRETLAYRAGDVLHEDGDVQTEFDPGGESPDQWFAHIGGRKLEITKEAYQALTPGGPYRIFYIAGPNRVVGGQVLTGWRPLAPPKHDKKRWWSDLSIQLG